MGGQPSGTNMPTKNASGGLNVPAGVPAQSQYMNYQAPTNRGLGQTYSQSQALYGDTPMPQSSFMPPQDRQQAYQGFSNNMGNLFYQNVTLPAQQAAEAAAAKAAAEQAEADRLAAEQAAAAAQNWG